MARPKNKRKAKGRGKLCINCGGTVARGASHKVVKKGEDGQAQESYRCVGTRPKPTGKKAAKERARKTRQAQRAAATQRAKELERQQRHGVHHGL